MPPRRERMPRPGQGQRIAAAAWRLRLHDAPRVQSAESARAKKQGYYGGEPKLRIKVKFELNGPEKEGCVRRRADIRPRSPQVSTGPIPRSATLWHRHVSRARCSAPPSNYEGYAKFSGAVHRRRGTPVLSRTSNRDPGSAA